MCAVGVAAVPMVKSCLASDASPSKVYDTKKMDTPLHKAASTPGWRPGAAEVVTLLLEAGAAVNAVNDLEVHLSRPFDPLSADAK